MTRALLAVFALGATAASDGAIDAARADRISAACLSMAAHEGWKMQIAILNAQGDLVRFVKMDGASRATGVLALEKARTVFRSGRSTRDMARMDPSGQRAFGAVTIAGGVPYVAGDEFRGAIGVSGSHPDNDERCAQAGIDAAR